MFLQNYEHLLVSYLIDIYLISKNHNSQVTLFYDKLLELFPTTSYISLTKASFNQKCSVKYTFLGFVGTI